MRHPTMTKLYVYRDWATTHNGAWRLMWANPGGESYVCAEGECSAKLFKTMREAVAYGEERYLETATKWRGIGYEFT